MMSGVSAFIWQAALMLLGAYFLGAFTGCWLRRRFSAPPRVAMESRADRQIVGSSAVAAAPPSSERFGRALDGTEPVNRLPSSEPTMPPPVPLTTPAVLPSEPDNAPPAGAMGDAAARTASTEAVVAVPAAIAPVPPPAQMTPETPPMQIPPEAPPPVPPAPAPEQPKQFTPPMSAAAAAAAALAARQAATARKAEASAQPAIAEPTPDPAMSEDQPPAVAPPSVAAKMEPLAPSSSSPPNLPASSGSAGQATVAAQIEQVEVPSSQAEPDDLTMIEGVTDNDATALRNAGITTFGAIADWSADDVARVNASITGVRRVARENWIEQAQLLRGGGSTSYTRRILADLAPRPSAVSVLPSATSGSGQPEAHAANLIDTAEVDDRVDGTVPPAPASAPSEPETAPPDARADIGPDVSQRAAFARERRGYADDLQQIDGINSEVEKLLNEQGVTRVAQIAGWTKAEQQRIDQLLGSMNRVKRENWVGQARRISGFSQAPPEVDVSTSTDPQTIEIEPSPPPPGPQETDPIATAAIDDTADSLSEPQSNILPLSSVPAVARDNVRGLRSVRSEALVGANTVDSGNSEDDLKRIRGVGVLIEKRLRAMGYGSYERIGSWTQSDVDRVNQQLDFRGRIERENWIEQARILAAGGQTEFSRRQERNDD